MWIVALQKAYFCKLQLLVFPTANFLASKYRTDACKTEICFENLFLQTCTESSSIASCIFAQQRQRRKAAESQTHFTTSFGGATCYVLHYSMPAPNLEVQDCCPPRVFFDKNYSLDCTQACIVLFSTRRFSFWNKIEQRASRLEWRFNVCER